MTARKYPPLLLRSALTNRVYIVTRYTRDRDRPDRITASEKWDVTEQFETLKTESGGQGVER